MSDHFSFFGKERDDRTLGRIDNVVSVRPSSMIDVAIVGLARRNGDKRCPPERPYKPLVFDRTIFQANVPPGA